MSPEPCPNCNEDDPNDGYVCEECGATAILCGECYTVIGACPCGHCLKGAIFHEIE